MSSVPTRRDLAPDEELERATADYLRISRGAHLYASHDEHQRAEQAAWERLTAAREAIIREEGDAPSDAAPEG